MKNRRTRRGNKFYKVITSVILSAALLAEPSLGMSTVCAEGTQGDTALYVISEDDGSPTLDENVEGADGAGENSGDFASDESGKQSGAGENSGGSASDESGEQSGAEEDSGGFASDGSGEQDEAESDSPEENDAVEEDPDSTISGNEIDGALSEEIEDAREDEGAPKEDLEGFSDMPSGYRLTSFQRELKADMSGTLSQFNEDEEGVTFVEDQVITFAESEEEAEMIAEAYHAEIISFDMGVLAMELHGENTVKSALMAAADMDNNLPPVWPNYIRELYGEFTPATQDVTSSSAAGIQSSGIEAGQPTGTANVSTPELEIAEEEYVIDDVDAVVQEDEIPSLEAYEEALNELAGYDDPYLQVTSTRYQWFHTTIGSAYAWAAGYTGSGVKVGVIDSGVDANADLEANIFGKMDFCDGTTDVADCVGHGTHVAGIIAASANNASGGAGVAPQAQIFNARVFGTTTSKSGTDATVIAAINYLIGEEDNATGEAVSSTPARVDIINMSLGGPGKNGATQAVLNKAYQKGVIVFAATGNDGGSLLMYPASYDHVIGVSATDNNNERAYFSNYGTATDLSAPGVSIWSTYGSGFSSLQGTSMACPVVAGEAAVILSGKDTLSSLKDAKGNDKTGAARVDAVESIMKGNTISAGTGMGKGITNLAKVFKLSTAATKPNAPGITLLPDDTMQSVQVTIQAQDGMTLCYTTNGKNPVYKYGVAGTGTNPVNGNQAVFTIDCTNSAKGTIKAIAVNAAGVVSSVKSVSYTLRPYVKTITVSGSARVEQGKSIQLTAAVTPAYATNKSVTWEMQTSQGAAVDTAKIKIDQKGKITAAKDADTGTYTVTVRAKDEGQCFAQYSVQVVAAGSAIQSIAFDKNMTKELWLTKTAAAPTLELSSSVTAKEKNAAGVLTEIDSSTLGDRVIWTSSKPGIATVDDDGVVTAVAAGTTTITVKANDNGNKKTTVNITVKQAVTDIAITSDKGRSTAGNYTVAAGKNMTFKATVSPTKPTNKKVVWSIAPATGNSAGEADMKNITINKTSGKITVKAAALPGNYIVTAEAADGQGAKAAQTVRVCGGAIGEIKLDTTKTTLYTQKIDADKSNTKTIKATIKGANGTTDFDAGAYNVTSSNTSVVTAAVLSASPIDNGDGTFAISINITATGDMYGKSNITIAATDGSNKKAVCAVTVSGGIKTVQMQDGSGKKVSKLALFRTGTDTKSPKTASIYAVIQGSEGANNEAYEVISSNPSLVQVTTDKTTGQIALTAGGKATGKATITLMATDGSKKKATCTVTVNNPPSKINIAPASGTTKYVAPGKSMLLKATLETEYGAVASKGVTWSLPDSYKGTGITVNASGKVSVSGSYSTTGSVPVTATAKDGSGISATYNVSVVKPTTYISAGKPTGNGVYTITFSSDCSTPMSCTSSAPSVISPTISYSSSTGTGTIKFIALKKGTSIITIKALDSTNKTYRIACRVN